MCRTAMPPHAASYSDFMSALPPESDIEMHKLSCLRCANSGHHKRASYPGQKSDFVRVGPKGDNASRNIDQLDTVTRRIDLRREQVNGQRLGGSSSRPSGRRCCSKIARANSRAWDPDR